MPIAKLVSLVKGHTERITSGVRQIETDHAYIHEGILFETFTRFTLATGISKDIAIITPADFYLHYRMEKVVSSGDKVSINLYEGATLDTPPGGSALTPMNHNRESGVNSATEVLEAPTVTADGLQIAQGYIGGGTGQGQSRIGTDLLQANEWVLSPDTVYLVRITNGSSADNIIQCNLMWYEEDSA